MAIRLITNLRLIVRSRLSSPSSVFRKVVPTPKKLVTFASVAREAGVSTALIHNYYPQIAKAIREAQGRSSRTMRDVKHQKLIAERKKSADYRREIEEMRAKIANLASINEVILAENRILNEELSKRKVVAIATRTP
jgi:AcrR family transcriptional regulator